MTHEEKLDWLRNCDKETISPKEASKILGGSPFYFNIAAKNGTLTLPHMWMGRDLRIFRAPILRLLEGGSIQ